jgi:integrase-like protein
VFATSIGTPIGPRALDRDFDKVRRKAGLPTVRLHDLRHTVVSLLLHLGTPPHVVQAIARHADVTMTIYAHTNLDARGRRSTPSIGRPSNEPLLYDRCQPGPCRRPGLGVRAGRAWSGWRDSNPRPLAPKASALPSCATPRCG